jgi:hypothetical protein
MVCTVPHTGPICGHEYDQNRKYLSDFKKRLLRSTMVESIRYSEGIN